MGRKANRALNIARENERRKREGSQVNDCCKNALADLVEKVNEKFIPVLERDAIKPLTHEEFGILKVLAYLNETAGTMAGEVAKGWDKVKADLADLGKSLPPEGPTDGIQ
jgi:hypothetical protein